MRKLLALFFYSIAFTSTAQVNRPYFQQEVNYEIEVKLNDQNHTLSGKEKIEYINHSPHTLSLLYFHLWPNAYRNKNTALAKQLLENGETEMHFANVNEDYGYIDSLLFVVNGDTIKWEYDSLHIDIAILYLKTPLKSNDTLHISTPFKVKIPASFSRLGHVNQSYQITQWYPKPAVYDHSGWNQMPYLDQGEFYSEFGTFDVKITVPENYVIAATGDLYECPKEEKWLEQKAKKTLAMFQEGEVNKIGNLIGDQTDEFPESAKTWKTLRYRQKNIHDFAWFADKRFYVLRGEVNLPKSGRNVTSWAYFTQGNSKYWKKSIEYLNDAITYYSKWNGEYPYNVVSAVDGTISAGGGMEYPTITVIGDVSSDFSLETVIMHEVGHNWFYGILGSNERLHPWMDEGLNSFNELRYIETKYPNRTLYSSFAGSFSDYSGQLGLKDIKYRLQYYLSYIYNARRNYDQPIEGKAEEFTSVNYGAIVYSKTALAFDYLRSYLGEVLFDKCMHAYYDRWKFAHPTPEDLKQVFQEVSRKDLSWFFDDYLNGNEVIDYKIKRKKKVDTRSKTTYGWIKYEESLVIVNKGSAVVPFCINGIKGDTVNTQVWYAGHKGKQTVHFPNGPYQYFMIDFKERIPEVDRKNNMLKEKGLFKRSEKFRIHFLGGVEESRRTVLYLSPVIGFNKYDGLMGGILLHNNLFPVKPIEWQLMPVFGFKSKRPAGYAGFNHRINTRKNNLINHLEWGVGASSFQTSYYDYDSIINQSGYVRISPRLDITFKKKMARSKNLHRLFLRSDIIIENSFNNCNGNCLEYNLQESFSTNTYYNNLRYQYSNAHVLHPWMLNFDIQQNSDFLRASIEGVWKFIYNKKLNFVQLRAFVGHFIYNNSTLARFNWRMDGQRGYHDYTYSQPFVGRMEQSGFWSKQFLENHGAMKVQTGVAQSNSFISAINLKANLPIPIIRLFADAGYSINSNGNSSFVYDAGVYVTFFKGFTEIYFPLIYSKNIRDEYQANNRKFKDGIRFTLNLNLANPFQRLKTLPH